MGELEQLAFETMARSYPHEMFQLEPEEFWKFFHRQYPEINRETMEVMLSAA